VKILPEIWPRDCTDAHRDYCEWLEQYSDC